MWINKKPALIGLVCYNLCLLFEFWPFWLEPERSWTLPVQRKEGIMRRKNKQSEKVVIALLSALTAMFNFLANLVHLWTK